MTTLLIPYRKYTDIVRDPIYNYIDFTKSSGNGEIAEKDIIDTPPFQRLRQIHQLQSAWIVYPGAEHTRFQHSLGTMHLCGIFANHLYSPLRNKINGPTNLPETNMLVEELRLSGLLHDIGHGPFGHLLDDTFLFPNYKITHEDISQKIIKNEYQEKISKINRSPYGKFSGDLNFKNLINRIKHNNEDYFTENYQKSLYKILHGIWTADTLDFIQRDAYFCGTKEYSMIDADRLINSSIIPDEGGLALYKTSESALQAFLLSRIFMFTSVYYHRTARAYDISVKKLLPKTMEILGIGNPIKENDSYQKYLELTEFNLFSEVKKWSNEIANEKSKLAIPWKKIINRDLEWRHVYSQKINPLKILGEEIKIKESVILDIITKQLPPGTDSTDIEIDIPYLDVKNPFQLGKMDYAIYDPDEEKIVDQKGVNRILIDLIPNKIIYFSVYAKKDKRKNIQDALKKADKEELKIEQITNY